MLKMTGGADILHCEDILVVADGCCVVTDDGSCDFTLGLSLVMAVYWLYGFEYPKELRKTFSFLEKCVFNLKSTRSTMASVARLHSDPMHRV